MLYILVLLDISSGACISTLKLNELHLYITNMLIWWLHNPLLALYNEDRQTLVFVYTESKDYLSITKFAM